MVSLVGAVACATAGQSVTAGALHVAVGDQVGTDRLLAVTT